MISRKPDHSGSPPPDAQRVDESAALRAVARSLRFRLEVNRSLGWSMPVAPTVVDERARRQALLDEVDGEVKACEVCPLHSGRANTVFGVGDPCARLMFIGEGPGFDEDRQGEPFVGKAGQLLDRMIVAMGLQRSGVYIANIVKCRPPKNRTPDPRECLACLPYLRRQIDIIQPEVICTLGTTPLKAVLESADGVVRARGRVMDYHGIPAVPTFHPAYLLRNAADKGKAWDDLKTVLGLLQLPLPKR